MNLIIGLLIGCFSFEALGEGLDRMGISLFKGLQHKTRDLKHKKVWQYTSFLMIGIMLLSLVMISGLGDLPQGFILGSLYGLICLIFEDSFFDKLRNTLR